MTTAALDPPVAIAAAGRELLDSLRQLVDRDPTDNVPGLLDELTALLRRARGKVNRATARKPEETPGREATLPPAPTPAAARTSNAPGSTVGPSASTRPAEVGRPPVATSAPPDKRAVTLAIPTATRQPARPDKPPPKGVPMPATVIRRRFAWPVVAAVVAVLAVVLIILLAGCSTSPAAPAPAVPTVTQMVAKPNEVECVNVERAHNAWKWSPSDDPSWFRQVNLKRLIESGDDFYKALQGYKDKGATALALEVARYNVDLSTLNVQFAAYGGSDDGTASRIVDGVGRINVAFASFKVETCLDM